MAIENFKKELWSAKLQTDLNTLTSLRNHCDYQFEGDVKGGKSLEILNVTRPTAKTYVPGTPLVRDGVAGTKQTLLIDQFNYIDIEIDDIEVAQTDGTIGNWASEGLKALADTADAYVGSLAVGATQKSASTVITSANVVATLNEGFKTLLENNVPTNEVLHLEVSPKVYMAMKEAIIDLDTNNSEMIKMGYVGKYSNAMVSVENLLHVDTDVKYCMLRTKKAIAYAEQIESVEAYRPQDSFSDAVKALHVSGAKLVRDEEIYVILSNEA